jgi:lauroyl/myristoyl acyltransferase
MCIARWEKRFASRAKPDGDCLSSWIRMAEHTLSEITRTPETWFHFGSRFGTTFSSFDRSEKCFP